MSFGFGFGFTKITAAIRAAFSPSSLFAANEPGVWYDPSDMSTLFQDSAGTTPVTAVEQPVGLMLDKSKGLVLGPVLGPELVTNGTFDTGINGWGTPENNSGTLIWVPNAMRVTRTGAAAAGSQGISVTSGKTYKVSCTFSVVSGTGVGLYLLLKTSNSATGATAASSTTTASAGSSGTLTFIYTASSTATLYLMGLLFGGGIGTVDFDNISVRELPGNHASQPTATSRPVLSARVNLLTKTEQFDDAAWTKLSLTVTANAALDPLGGTTADLIYPSSSGNNRLAYVAASLASRPTRLTYYLKSAGFRWAAIGTNTSLNEMAFFDLQNGVVGGVGSALTGATIVDIGGGWFRCGVTATASAGGTASTAVWVVDGNNTQAATSNGTSGIYIWGASLVPTNQSSLPYQRVNTATDYDTVGFPHYLRFDGVDDWLVTNTITPGIDKAQVFAGVRRLTNASAGIILEASSNVATNSGSFWLVSGDSSYQYSAVFRGTGALTSAIDAKITSASFAPPSTSVITATSEIQADLTRISGNGVLQTSATGDQGTGNFLAYPLYIGRRGGTTLPFNGHLYGLIVRFGSNLPTATIEQTEKYINTKTRAY